MVGGTMPPVLLREMVAGRETEGDVGGAFCCASNTDANSRSSASFRLFQSASSYIIKKQESINIDLDFFF